MPDNTDPSDKEGVSWQDKAEGARQQSECEVIDIL